MAVKSTNEVTVYEIGDEEKMNASPLIVESHWNRSGMVVIKVGSTHVTVRGSDLVTAIHNAERR